MRKLFGVLGVLATSLIASGCMACPVYPSRDCASSPEPCGVSAYLNADGSHHFYKQYLGSIYVEHPIGAAR